MRLAALGDFLFRFRDALIPVAFALVLVPGPRVAADPAVPLLIGALVALAGQALRALTIGLKYIVRGGRNRRVYAIDLVTDGVYGLTRNPMYVGNLLIFAGIAIASNSILCLALGVPLALVFYAAIVAAEERFLRQKFGPGYDEYARAVPRWAVRLDGIGDALAGTEFHWRRLLVKEYGTTTGWILAICATAWISFLRSTGDPPEPGLRIVLYALAAGAVIFWALARSLKKSRLIVAD